MRALNQTFFPFFKTRKGRPQLEHHTNINNNNASLFV